MKKITGGVALFRKFDLYELNGVVQSETTRAETEVEGTISGGQGYGVGGNQIHGKIQSKTTRFQSIFMTDDDGGEHAINLVDMVVPCREGHKLTLWSVDGKCWFEAINRSTDQAFENRKGLRGHMFPELIIAIAVLGVFAFVLFKAFTQAGEPAFFSRLISGSLLGLLLGGLVSAILLIPGKIVSGVRADSVRAALKKAASAAIAENT